MCSLSLISLLSAANARSFVDQCSAMDLARNSERARCITRVSACLTALEGVLRGTSSFSPIRRHAIAFSVAALTDSMIFEVFSTDDLLAVEGHLNDLTQIASIEETLHQLCDCSFLYFYRDLVPDFVSVLYRSSLNSAAPRGQLVLSALSDPERILKHVRHLERDASSGVTPCFVAYRNFVLSAWREGYAQPVCELIETDLRYVDLGCYSFCSAGVVLVPACAQTLSLSLSVRLAASGALGGDKRLRKFTTAPPLYICQVRFSLKNEVEDYLEKIFYDLSALNLNDCNAYNEMRTVANERYGLCLTDPYLPDGSLEQGIDFIDVLRDLDCEYNVSSKIVCCCRNTLSHHTCRPGSLDRQLSSLNSTTT